MGNEATRIKKGQVLNPNGRPKGSLSAKTQGWELLKETITTGLTDKFMREMESLEGTAYINAYLNVMEYFKPKLSRSEVISQNENIETITVTLSQTMVHFPDNVDETEAEEISSLHPTDKVDETQA
jgi:hypothetical protein